VFVPDVHDFPACDPTIDFSKQEKYSIKIYKSKEE
jgi:hypothetical protein